MKSKKIWVLRISQHKVPWWAHRYRKKLESENVKIRDTPIHWGSAGIYTSSVHLELWLELYKLVNNKVQVTEMPMLSLTNITYFTFEYV